MSNAAYSARSDGRPPPRRRPCISTERKASIKTSEMIAYVAAVSQCCRRPDLRRLRGPEPWFYVSLLTIGYLVSRGLAKSGSRNLYDDDRAPPARRVSPFASVHSAGRPAV